MENKDFDMSDCTSGLATVAKCLVEITETLSVEFSCEYRNEESDEFQDGGFELVGEITYDCFDENANLIEDAEIKKQVNKWLLENLQSVETLLEAEMVSLF